MIQRVQSVFLFLTFLLNGSVFFNALYQRAIEDPSQWIPITFTAVLIVAALFPLACIFLYNNRQIQLRFVNISLLFNVVMLGFGIGLFVTLGTLGNYLWKEAVGVGLILVALIFQWYSQKKIKDDIELVNSMDRIR